MDRRTRRRADADAGEMVRNDRAGTAHPFPRHTRTQRGEAHNHNTQRNRNQVPRRLGIQVHSIHLNYGTLPSKHPSHQPGLHPRPSPSAATQRTSLARAGGTSSTQSYIRWPPSPFHVNNHSCLASLFPASPLSPSRPFFEKESKRRQSSEPQTPTDPSPALLPPNAHQAPSTTPLPREPRGTPD